MKNSVPKYIGTESIEKIEVAEGHEAPVVVPPVTNIVVQVELAVALIAEEVRRVEVATVLEEPRFALVAVRITVLLLRRA